MGEPLTGRVVAESGVTFEGVAIGSEESQILISNSAGFGFISNLANAISNQKKGKQFMKKHPMELVLSLQSLLMKIINLLLQPSLRRITKER